jgi:hypothetical protein
MTRDTLARPPRDHAAGSRPSSSLPFVAAAYPFFSSVAGQRGSKANPSRMPAAAPGEQEGEEKESDAARAGHRGNRNTARGCCVLLSVLLPRAVQST